MTIHTLKCWPEYFEPLISGAKTLDLRLDDRGYVVGDILHSREWEPMLHSYSGRECWHRVTHIVRNYEGLRPGYVAMSVALVVPEKLP